MTKKIVLILIICIIVLPYISLKFYSHYSDNTFITAKPPIVTAQSLKLLSTALIQSQEDFNGSISIKTQTTDHNKAEIIFINNYSDDDSIGAREYKMIAKKKGNVWTVTESKIHWKCDRDLFFSSFWTTSNCS